MINEGYGKTSEDIQIMGTVTVYSSRPMIMPAEGLLLGQG
jgi:hypothetical protein